MSYFNRRRDIRLRLTVSLFLIHLSCDNFCPVSRIVAPRADMQIEKQKDPAKTGLVRCLVSKSHGSEVCNCCVQRVFFSLSAGSRNRGLSQLCYEKKNPLAPRVTSTVTPTFYFINSMRTISSITEKKLAEIYGYVWGNEIFLSIVEGKQAR